MVRQTSTSIRPGWEDRFKQPSIKSLRSVYSIEDLELFDTSRETLRDICNNRETVLWRGTCWKWCIEYRLRQRGKPFALLIPNPVDLQVALPVDETFIQSVWDRQMKRAVREGLELAAAPYDSEWCLWTLSSKPMMAEVIDLIFRKAGISDN